MLKQWMTLDRTKRNLVPAGYQYSGDLTERRMTVVKQTAYMLVRPSFERTVLVRNLTLNPHHNHGGKLQQQTNVAWVIVWLKLSFPYSPHVNYVNINFKTDNIYQLKCADEILETMQIISLVSFLTVVAVEEFNLTKDKTKTVQRVPCSLETT